MAEHILKIDYNSCTGCRLCEVVCSLASDGEINPQRSRVRIIKIQEEARSTPFPITCMHCEHPPCQAVCPMQAISTDPATGARKIDPDKCIGCSMCVYACPFGAMGINRSVGCAYTCTLCNGDPTCAKLCPTGALQYVDGEEISLQHARSRLYGCLESLTTRN